MNFTAAELRTLAFLCDDQPNCPMEIGSALREYADLKESAEKGVPPEAGEFARLVMDGFFGNGSDIGSLDGFELQEMAVKAGLLAEHEIESDAGCGERCNCIGNGAGAGDICYRPTPALLALKGDKP